MNKLIKVLSILIVIITLSVSFNTYAITPEVTENDTTTSTTIKEFTEFKCYVKKNKINTYKKPSKNSSINKIHYKGKKFTVYEVKGKWYRVGKDKWIHSSNTSKKNPMKKYNGIRLKYMNKYNITDNKLTKRRGVVYYKGHRETYYSQRVLPGKGLNIPGRHIASDGTIRDEDGYICISVSPSYKRDKGSKIMTSLGPGKVYDSGVSYGTVDIYTNW